MSSAPSALVLKLQQICGEENVFWRPEDLLVWEYDAGFDRRPPAAVALPGTAEEVATVVRAAREAGLFFAPDPASQRISTIGGNVATNAGGPHALRYGAMVNHVLGIELVLPNGETERFGGDVADLPGFDCVPLIVGSEGTLGIITKIWLRLLPLPEAVRTFVAIFADSDSGARAASAIIASGVVPAAMEMLDNVTIGALNAAFDVHLPTDAGSLLLVEVEGLSEETADWAASIVRVLKKNGATDVRSAATQAERELLWKARKLGYAALARIRPNNYLHDAVVPRSKVPDVLRE